VNTYIALFRGINVVGNNVLPMRHLAALCEDLGCKNVRTYIQSGNVIFQSRRSATAPLARKIRAEIAERHGFEPHVLLLTVDEMAQAIRSNPFPEAAGEPKSLHLNFLAATPESPDLDALERLRKPNERFRLVDSVFYLHAPDGIGRSKLAANLERHLRVAATSRNWRTVCSIMELATTCT